MTTLRLNSFRKPLALSSCIVFAISLAFYWITADPGVSYWDCPEYVTVASGLENGHPPGNPVWMLVMRVATIPFSYLHHAYVVNLCSGIFMAFAAFFLCRIIFTLLGSISWESESFKGTRKNLVISLTSIGASLCFALCDSTWFSATEAEVYAMSAFLASASLWIMVVWWNSTDRGKQFRLLVLIAYITGLSLGVHQLNLLLIPVFALIIFFRHHPRRINPFYGLLIIFISFGIVGFVLLGLIPGILYGAGKFELFGVNTLSLPYHGGIGLFVSLLILLWVIMLLFIQRIPRRTGILSRRNVSLSLWMTAFLLLGFSSFAITMIRGNAYPAMNEGVPDNIFSLTSYISRDQYPSTPLLYGATPYSQPMFEETMLDSIPTYTRYVLEKGKPVYSQYVPGGVLHPRSGMLSAKDSAYNEVVINKGRGYILTDYTFQQMLTPELNMCLPRITSRNVSDRMAYADWAGMTEDNMDKVIVSETIDSLGNYAPRVNRKGDRVATYSYRPTYLQHLNYFIAYQSYYMYFRYLFWNFIGRQNDYASTGEIEHGNFITGIPWFDSTWLGNTSQIPDEIWSRNKGRNRYFGIPFIFGLIGIFWLMAGNMKKRRIMSLVTLLFFMTGLAIVIYLNQTPGEPRERDYTFLISYYAFAIWIAMGFFAVASSLKKLPYGIVLAIAFVLAMGTPTLMAIENFDDHDRRGRFEPTFYASSLLDFEEPAVIFTHGDNTTFPVWYASEILKMGRDHTPIDVTYMALPSYILNLKKQGNRGINTIGKSPQLAYGKYTFVKIPTESSLSPLPLREALDRMYASEKVTPEFPGSVISLPGLNGDTVNISLKKFTRGSSYMPFKTLMLLDIIASQSDSDNPKVIYFPYSIDYSFHKALEPVLYPVLFGKIYAPSLPDSLKNEVYRKAVTRELSKLNELEESGKSFWKHYSDPVITDRTKRYRGEMILAAQQMLQQGDTAVAIEIARVIDRQIPYEKLLPGAFTMADSTFYEGKEFVELMDNLYVATGNESFRISADSIQNLMQQRKKQWVRYYNSLSLQQKRTLSNRSRRLVFK